MFYFIFPSYFIFYISILFYISVYHIFLLIFLFPCPEFCYFGLLIFFSSPGALEHFYPIVVECLSLDPFLFPSLVTWPEGQVSGIRVLLHIPPGPIPLPVPMSFNSEVHVIFLRALWGKLVLAASRAPAYFCDGMEDSRF